MFFFYEHIFPFQHTQTSSYTNTCPLPNVDITSDNVQDPSTLVDTPLHILNNQPFADYQSESLSNSESENEINHPDSQFTDMIESNGHINLDPSSDSISNTNSPPTIIPTRTSSRTRKPPAWLSDFIMNVNSSSSNLLATSEAENQLLQQPIFSQPHLCFMSNIQPIHELPHITKHHNIVSGGKL